MSSTLRRLRTFGLYLLPASLLATTGALLMGLLYYPTPSTADKPQLATVEDATFWRAHADDMLVILLADAMRQLREEQDGHGQMQMHQYDAPSTDQRLFSRVIPMRIENGIPAKRPVLIRL